MGPGRSGCEEKRRWFGGRYLPEGAMIRDRDAAVKGVGLAVLVVLSMTYALSVLGTTGFGNLGWSFLGLGILFVGALTAPYAMRLLREGLVGLPGAEVRPSIQTPDGKSAERQLLEAVSRHGKTTPARVALETTLTVAEADRMLGGLAGSGHLAVETEGNVLVYFLPGSAGRGIEDR